MFRLGIFKALALLSASCENLPTTFDESLLIGGTVPWVHTVTGLNETTLKYHDAFGVYWSFTKVGKGGN